MGLSADIRDRANDPESAALAVMWIRNKCERGVTIDYAAAAFARQYPLTTAGAMDRLGMWPSSEPELAALQRAAAR